MRLFIKTAVICAALLSGAAVAQTAQPVTRAKAAAASWLALVDAGHYTQSWTQASKLFKSSVSKPSWSTAVRNVRDSLGALKARQVRSAKFTSTLPGVPDGRYVVIQYASRFEHKAKAVETVTCAREADGSWRVAGYFVK